MAKPRARGDARMLRYYATTVQGRPSSGADNAPHRPLPRPRSVLRVLRGRV